MNFGLRRWLERANPLVFTLFAGLAGFCAYFSMYAFRKPFAAATFGAVDGWSFAVDYKIALVLAQVAGYAASKMIGVKVISEIAPRHRGAAILGLIGLSWLALLAFAVIPAPWNVAALFLNGLPLGMIWGLVFGFMEGRRTSEVLGAILCASFILSSGVVKSIGKWLMVDIHVSPFWMPAATGAIFMPLLAVSVWALMQLPPPSAADEAARVRRQPMDRAQRRAFLAAYAPGVVLLVLSYILLTALRDFRDNFAAELWTALGYGEASGVFTASELPVAVVSLAAIGAVMLVRDNLRALLVMHGVILAGFLMLGLSTLAFQAHLLGPLAWMVLTGAGLYMAYTPFNAMLFDRMIAFSGRVGTAGFLIYVADASGYLGSVALLVWRNFAMVTMDWLGFFIASAYATCVVGAACATLSGFYFLRHRPAIGDRPAASATVVEEGAA
uniref:Major facilitator superfamily MFS_1 n=1 Tax=Caulobacter sp. (strain K31) TaxID=366602 RepID=B0T0N3_CAUSK